MEIEGNTATCKGIPANILSQHLPSEERDEAWVIGTTLTPPRYCLNCNVYLPEDRKLSHSEILLAVNGVWWNWLAHQAPNGIDGLRTTLYETIKDGITTLGAEDEKTIMAILTNRIETYNLPKVLERLRNP